MAKRALVLLTITAFIMTALMVPVASAKGLRKPVVKLLSVEVREIQAFYLNMKKGRGAIINLACVFSIYNPNKRSVYLDSLSYALYFDDFYVNTMKYRGKIWIPARKTVQIDVYGSQSARTLLLNLLVTNGAKLQAQADAWNKAHPNAKKKKTSGAFAGANINRWFTTIADYKFPIYLKKGAAIFTAPGGRRAVVNINFKYHPK
ncbi:MAG: LEA type 2 family protein [Proteobacteria bacterium]|nr:LEA type 2 family protein [Pseudomonadota bacterium]